MKKKKIKRPSIDEISLKTEQSWRTYTSQSQTHYGATKIETEWSQNRNRQKIKGQPYKPQNKPSPYGKPIVNKSARTIKLRPNHLTTGMLGQQLSTCKGMNVQSCWLPYTKINSE